MKITECVCNGDCACAENFQKTADLRKYFEENSSIFATPKRNWWHFWNIFTVTPKGKGK